MRFLLDENLSPLLADLLARRGHDVLHVRELGLKSAPDDQVLDAAADRDCVLVSADTDFGAILAMRHLSGPSVLLIRRVANRRAVQQASLIIANLDAVADDLAAGAIVLLGDRTIRVRPLPI